ncbi:MAG: sugar phosphate isomerase/epimerase [Ruminococcaceae bacterium]|nr:sugar phosphate isomerase/epimerase [Oscillospiraceae bacterium]
MSFCKRRKDMILSSNMIRFHDAFGMKNTFDIFACAGIGGMDFNNDAAEYYSEEHGEEFYRDLGEYAREKGIKICQAHAPFASSYPEEEKSAKRFEDIVRSIKYASWLGAPMIVVHPCCHLDYSAEGNAEKLFEYNLDFYRRLIPHAREYNIKIAIENIGYVSVTSTPERLGKLYDTLNDPVFTVCFDVGHCLLEKVDPAEAIRYLGDRLVNGCTHVHDNCGVSDDHTLPYYGKVDWESVMKALADIGYNGDLNYEASGFIKDIPVSLRPDGLAYMARIGHYLISRFEYYKENK